jgi:predicted Zn finger-like uncharacterized protein
MILTCPDCATSYFVDDDRVPPQGRTVKCSSCGNRWRAMPDGAPEPKPPPAPTPAAGSGEIPDTLPVGSGDDLAIVSKAKAPKPKAPPEKKRRVGIFIGLGVAVALIGAIGAAVLFRQAVVDAVPATAPVFEAVGLEVDTLGLAIEDVTFKAVLQAGRPVLSITGVIRNKNKVATEAPPIRLSLLDKSGAPLASLLAQPLNARVPPGGRRYFAVSFPDPPASSAKLETAFDLTAKPAGHAPAGHAAPDHAEAAHAPAEGHAPEAVEAKPLPADSPDALTPHEQH